MSPKNPKQSDADARVPLHLVPPVFEIGVAMVLRDGARQPGRWEYNWRDNPVKLTTYISACLRHLKALQSGEDRCPKSGYHHVDHVGANCAIIRDSEAVGTLQDDRPRHSDGTLSDDGAADLMRAIEEENKKQIEQENKKQIEQENKKQIEQEQAQEIIADVNETLTVQSWTIHGRDGSLVDQSEPDHSEVEPHNCEKTLGEDPLTLMNGPARQAYGKTRAVSNELPPRVTQWDDSQIKYYTIIGEQLMRTIMQNDPEVAKSMGAMIGCTTYQQISKCHEFLGTTYHHCRHLADQEYWRKNSNG